MKMKIQSKPILIKCLLYGLMSFILASCQNTEPESIHLYKNKQYKQAIPLLKADANNGNAQAQFYLGKLYADGNILKKDEDEALIWYRKSARQNNGDAQYSIAQAYFYGHLGLEKDRKKAFDLYEKSAKSGNTDSQIKLGLCYYFGEGTPKDYKQSFIWLKKGTRENKKESKYAYFLLGNMLFKGLGVQGDPAESAKWFEKAAVLGDAHSQAMLASQYYEGLGVPKSIEKAQYWAEKSAEQGNEGGKYFLGIIYEHTDKKTGKAIVLYKQASENGMPLASFRLAQIYEEGKGVDKDMKKAFRYYKLAADQGSKEAMEKVTAFEKRNLSE